MAAHAFPELTAFSRQAVRSALEHCTALLPANAPLLAVDGTCGNGHDTLFLAKELAALRPGGGFHLLGFDVQEAALAATRARLKAANALEGVRLLREGHECLAGFLPEDAVCAAAVYNLGFLPGSDKRLTTRAGTTLAALRAVADILAPGGVLSVHAYAGHPGGQEEATAVDAWFSALPYTVWTVARYSHCNKARNPEILFLAERKSHND